MDEFELNKYFCSMFQDFKPVLKILLRFIIIYVVLVLGYQFYLNGFKNQGLDPVSEWVAKQVAYCQNTLGYTTAVVHGKPAAETSWFYVKGKYVSRMVEGCNAISVMILFVAFVFAFYKGLRTFLFAGAGIVLLHGMNVARIVGLNIVLSDYPQYSKVGHDYFFPAIIYGSVVLLWLIWVQFFALKRTENEII